jgi:hypothetical protein
MTANIDFTENIVHNIIDDIIINIIDNSNINTENTYESSVYKKYMDQNKIFIITDKSDSNFEEDFTDKEYYDMYVNNIDFNIMEMSEILSIFPEFLYSIIREFSNEYKKEIRGYNEYKNYVKNHNNLCKEIYKWKNKENEIESEIQILNEQIQMLEEEKLSANIEKKMKKKEYNLFMKKIMGTQLNVLKM